MGPPRIHAKKKIIQARIYDNGKKITTATAMQIMLPLLTASGLISLFPNIISNNSLSQ